MMIKSISFCVTTYNRKRLLSELLNSIIKLKKIKDIKFEIVIFDDGSTDSTKMLVNDYIIENLIPIRYYYHTNRGRATTLLKVINLAKNDFTMIMDDDDLLPQDFFIKLDIINKQISHLNQISGISFLCSNLKGKIIGDYYKKNLLISNYFDVLTIYKKKGDTGDLIKTQVLKNNLYNEIKNEKRASTGLIHLNLSKEKKFAFINQSLKIKRYYFDGISNNILYYKTISPNYSVQYEHALLCFKSLPLLAKIRCFININRFYLHGANKIKTNFINNFYLRIFYIFSLIIFFKDKIKLKKYKI